MPAAGVILVHALTRAGHRPILGSSVKEGMRVVARSPIDLMSIESGAIDYLAKPIQAETLEIAGRRASK